MEEEPPGLAGEEKLKLCTKNSYDRMRATDNRNKHHGRCHNGKRRRKLSTYEMEMSISYRVRTKVPQKNYIWEISGGDRKDLENNMQSVRNRVDRSAGMSGSYPYASVYTTKDECIKIHGHTQRKKQSDDIRSIRPTEIQISDETERVYRPVHTGKPAEESK